jgi:FkbM family methyltransferase
VFEPSPRSAALIKRNLRDNAIDNVTVVQAAVSDKPGTMNLNEGQTSGFSHVVTAAHLGGGQYDATLTEVPVVVIDVFLKARVSFVKIDVEGHEPNVLAGMKRVIEQGLPLIYTEFNPWCLIAFGSYNIAALARCIFDIFEVFVVSPQGDLVPIDLTPIGFVYKTIVDREIHDIALKLRPGRFVPTSEEMTLSPAIFAELAELRARAGRPAV